MGGRPHFLVRQGIERRMMASQQAQHGGAPTSTSSTSVAESNPKEIEEVFKRLLTQRGVVGVMCFTSEGSTVRTTLTPEETASYARVLTPFLSQAKSVSAIVNPKEDLVLLRLTTKKNELMVVPEQKYTMVAVKTLDYSDA